jgi:TPP-dependent pyruvate/acetoin dehydrogenase alpha subunit
MASLDRDRLLELFQKMVLVRKMEEKHAATLKSNIKIAFAHLGTGQEAVGIGATAALRNDDVMMGCHRGFAEYIGKGMDPVDLWAEYLGKKKVLNGKAGIQVSDREHNIPGMSACIGGSYAIAVGIAYAIKYRKEDRVVMISYGDGGYNQSDAHPAMVFASSLKLPVIFHVTYNSWAQNTRSEVFNPTQSVAARGAAYNIPARSVDGQRVDLVYAAAREAVEHARSGKGPYLMEYRTYRMALHWSGDRGEYIDDAARAEKREWEARDPIKFCQEMLIQEGIVAGSDIPKIVAEIDNRVEESFNFALRLPNPDVQDLCSNVFC